VDRIRENELFRNPKGLSVLRSAYGIDEYASWLFGDRQFDREREWSVDSLRAEQANVSSQSALRSGVALAQKGRLSRAVEHYEVALEWDAQNAAAMVAMGAAKAKQRKLSDAEKWLKRALSIDAETPNAAEYLSKVIARQTRTLSENENENGTETEQECDFDANVCSVTQSNSKSER